MKFRNIFYILAVLFISANSYCQDDTLNNSKKFDVDKLTNYYNNSYQQDEDISRLYQQKYFYLFPSSFSELVQIFGYKEDAKKLTCGTLYYDSKEYIDLFFHISNIIPQNAFCSKAINISLNGFWQSDGVSYFQNHLIHKVDTHLKCFINELQKLSDKKIYSFWKFYFDGPSPVDDIPIKLQRIKQIDNNMYDIMCKALKDVQKEWRNP